MVLSYTYWEDDGFFIGHFNNYPGHDTQGRTLEELEKMLADLYYDLELYNEPVLVRQKTLELAAAT
jgi:predicted RNase H-like HicB family nuclease